VTVFGFLRLPPSLATDTTKGGLRIGLQRTFYAVAALEMVAALACALKLRPEVQQKASRQFGFRKELQRLLLGFQLMQSDGELAVASLSASRLLVRKLATHLVCRA
jgi:hypothetical protein